MRAGDTIVAVASPPGRGARAIVRVSGVGARGLAAAVLRSESAGKSGAFAAVLMLGPGFEVPALVCEFLGPRSYTGEDSFEVQVPGNPALVERVLGALTSIPGVRLANPGEFTARAYLNGKLTLDQAEGVAATVAATNEEQLVAARSLLEGRAGAEYRRWAEELTTLLALVESGIDFTDQEDVVPIAPALLMARIEALRREIGAQLGHAGGREAAGALARVALVGRPNAGKSTLFNVLLGRKRAVTSPVSGTTRDVLAEELDLGRDVPGASAVLLEDLAGLEPEPLPEGRVLEGSSSQRPRRAADPAGVSESSRQAQIAANRAAAEADVLVWCDPTGRFDGNDLPLGPSKASVIRVRTFGDQPRGAGAREDLAVCALDGWHLAALRRALAGAALTSRAAGVAALLPRHRRAMGEAAASLGDAAESVGAGARLANPELTANGLRAALDSLGELVGQISPDEVLGRVFATFCVGK
jgi:tRNA modification GTPase